MKRRKFLVTSGTALLGSTAVNSVSQKPAVALNFDLVGVEDVQPSNTDIILVDFQNFELKPKYIDETASDATITITLDIDGHNKVQNQASVSLTNGQTVNASDLGSAVPIVQDNISSSNTALDGSITIDIDHPDVSDSYKQSFTITDDPLLNGLVGYWPLHEWSGQANDLSGNDNHGTVNGATQGVWGRGGITAYSFDGSDDYVSVPYLGVYAPDSAHTTSAWVYINSTGPTEIFSAIGEYNVRPLTYDWNGNQKLVFTTYDGTNTDNISSSQTLPTNEWIHVSTAYDNGNLCIYIDGVLDTATTVQNDYSTEPTSTNAIGAEHDGTGDHFDGSIVDVRVYNRALSPQEIQTLYEWGSQDYTDQTLHDGTDSGAVSRYEFTSGSVTADSWGSNTLTDNTSAGTTTDAIEGDAKSFDGTDDSLDDLSIKSLSSYTVSLWANFDDISGGTTDAALTLRNNNDIVLRADGGNLEGYHHDGSTNVKIFSKSGNSNVWYHLCQTWDGSTVKGFVNGSILGSSSESTLQNHGDTDHIGQNDKDSGHFDGTIDDVRIYDRALDPSEVFDLYNWGARGRDLRERTTTKNKNDMVGWWKLNETNGSTAYDSSGNGNDGTVNGAGPDGTGTVSSPIGQSAYDFDGNGDEINFDTSVIDSSDSFTVTFWLNADSSGNSRVVDTNDNDNGFRAFWTSGDEIEFTIENSGTRYTVTSNSYSQNEWIQGVCTFDGSRLVGYVNGVEFNSVSGASGGSDPLNLTIGNASSQSNNMFDGAIADVRIYDRALTPQEVSYLYEQKF